MAKDKIEQPEHLYRILVEPGGGYGQYPKFEKFWFIEKYDQNQFAACSLQGRLTHVG